jgi:outer membrane protein TolC
MLICVCACTVSPVGERAERERMEAMGAAYAPPIAERALPALRSDASVADYVAHALLAHGEVEAAHAQWRAALERVPQAGTQLATAMVGIEQGLGPGPWFERTGFVLASEAMNNLLFPDRLEERAAAALARAKVAAAEFDAVRVQRAREVAEDVYALARIDGEQRLLERLEAVLGVVVASATARVRAGASEQSALLLAQAAFARNAAELQALSRARAERLLSLRSRLGGVTPDFDPQPSLPPIEAWTDSASAGVRERILASPWLQMLAATSAAEQRAVVVAEGEAVPGFSLRGVLMGSGTANLGAMLSLPSLRDRAVAGLIAEARALREAALARARQGSVDVRAQLDAALAILASLEAEARIQETQVLPAVVQASDVARAAWTAGRGDLAGWASSLIDSYAVERALLALREAHAATRARLRALVGLWPEG